jgi:flagellar FliL protein
MAEEPKALEGIDDDEDGDGEEAPAPKRRLAGRIIVLYLVLPAIVVAGAVVGGLLFFQPFSDSGQQSMETRDAVFYDLPEILVNLSQQDKRSQFLKLKIALELSDREASSALQPILPRVLDTFQIYLRELRTDDLEGSAGIYRLKEELLRRVNLAIRPHKVDRILFKEIIVQ